MNQRLTASLSRVLWRSLACWPGTVMPAFAVTAPGELGDLCTIMQDDVLQQLDVQQLYVPGAAHPMQDMSHGRAEITVLDYPTKLDNKEKTT